MATDRQGLRSYPCGANVLDLARSRQLAEVRARRPGAGFRSPGRTQVEVGIGPATKRTIGRRRRPSAGSTLRSAGAQPGHAGRVRGLSVRSRRIQPRTRLPPGRSRRYEAHAHASAHLAARMNVERSNLARVTQPSSCAARRRPADRDRAPTTAGRDCDAGSAMPPGRVPDIAPVNRSYGRAVRFR